MCSHGAMQALTLLLETENCQPKSRFDPSSPFIFRQQLAVQSTTWQIGRLSGTSVRGEGRRPFGPPPSSSGPQATGQLALPESLTVPLCFTAGKRKKKEEQGKQDNANGNRNRKDTKDSKSGTKKRKSKQRGAAVPTTSASPAQ